MIRFINEKPIPFIAIIVTIFIFLVSCEGDDYGKIPFGYDPCFNYLEVLKSSPGYLYEATDGYPEFTYQEPADTNLLQLKSLYRLDSVAGTGDELGRIYFHLDPCGEEQDGLGLATNYFTSNPDFYWASPD